MCAHAYIKLKSGIVPDHNKITPKAAKSILQATKVCQEVWKNQI